jgi:hypothetical protein
VDKVEVGGSNDAAAAAAAEVAGDAAGIGGDEVKDVDKAGEDAAY